MDLLINPLIFIFIILKRFRVTKSVVLEIQKLVMNHKSRVVKLNSGQHEFSFNYVSHKN